MDTKPGSSRNEWWCTRPMRSILITGCSSGIGFETAKTLAARGWRVFATARSEKDVVELAHASFETLQLDVNDSESIRRAVTEVLNRTGGTLDALFNNAGYGQVGAVEDLTRDALREQFETNLISDRAHQPGDPRHAGPGARSNRVQQLGARLFCSALPRGVRRIEIRHGRCL